jgi:hypothetical protein
MSFGISLLLSLSLEVSTGGVPSDATSTDHPGTRAVLVAVATDTLGDTTLLGTGLLLLLRHGGLLLG